MEKRGRGSGLKWLLILIVLAGIGAAGWWYWKRPKDDAPEYRTAVVTRGDVIQAVTATGQLNPVANVQVGSQISGIIQQLYADFNSTVTQNQVIAELDPATFRAAVLQAEAELANAKAGMELTRIEARRADELRKTSLIPEADYDRAVAALHQAEAQVQLREAALERTRVDFRRCTIMAPTNGIVISRNVDVGQTVAASLSAPTLFVIANDLRNMQIDAMVSEADIGGIEVGQTVNFTVDAFPMRTFTGEVMQIRNAPITNQNVVTYDAVVAVDNSDLKLKPGMTANVSIILAEQKDVLKIPNSAMRFRPVDPEAAKKAAAAAPPPQAMAAMGDGERRGPRGEGGGRRGGGGRGGRPGGPSAERGGVAVRTIYTLPSTNSTAQPAAKQIKTGISDGAFTQVLEGLNENEIVVTGSNAADAARPMPTSNPFGPGMRRF